MSKLYIRVRTGFYTHRKTARLRVAIGDDAFWIPPRLWAYAAENQPDGNLSGYSSEEIAQLISCHKHAPSILQALKDAGFVDEDGQIHDWEEHAGYHKTFSDRARHAALARHGKKKEDKGYKDIGDKHCLGHASSKGQAWNPTPEQLRIGALFKRKPTRAFDDKELKAWNLISPIDGEDLAAVEKFYAANHPPDADYRIRSLQTLLNNWNRAVDQARRHSPKKEYNL